MKSGSFEAFQVLVACQVIPPACRICRIDSRLMEATTPVAIRCSASLLRLQVENGSPRSRGQHRAIRRIWRRTASLIVFGLPPAPFRVQRIEPHVVEVVDHPTDVLG
jgi:hypothetical protein